jgi:hypothetical protein
MKSGSALMRWPDYSGASWSAGFCLTKSKSHRRLNACASCPRRSIRANGGIGGRVGTKSRIKNKPELQRWIEDIGPELVQEAMDRELIPSRSDPLVIGVDCARFGDDMSVIFPRRGMDARTIKPLTFRNIPLDKLEDQVVAFCNANRVTQIHIDGTGLGGGLCDHLRRRGYLVTDVQFGARADQQIDGVRYANKRAEIWGLMRNALRYLCLPNSQALKEELTGPEYTFSRTSDAILLEPKDMMKRRGVPSPDLADALACTFGGEIATLPALADWVQPHGAISEYNPLSQAAMEGRYADAAIGGRAAPLYYAPGWAGLKEGE